MGKKYDMFKEYVETQNVHKLLEIQELSERTDEIDNIITYYKAKKKWESDKKMIAHIIGITMGLLIGGICVVSTMSGINYPNYPLGVSLKIASPAIGFLTLIDAVVALLISAESLSDIHDLKENIPSDMLDIDLYLVDEKVKELKQQKENNQERIEILKYDIQSNNQMIASLDDYLLVQNIVNNNLELNSMMNDTICPSEVQYINNEWENYLNEPVSFNNIDYNSSVCDFVKIKKIGLK